MGAADHLYNNPIGRVQKLDTSAADLPLKKALEFPILSNISTSCMDLV
jgi:hypothetical protein